MPYIDPNENREYQREWQRRKRLGLSTKIIDKPPILASEKRSKKKLREVKYRNQRKQMVNETFGTVCFVCNRKDAHIIHRKDGKPHRNLSDMGKHQLRSIIENDIDLYVRVCKLCHKGIHWSMTHLNINWDQIEFVVSKQSETRGSIPCISTH